MSGVADIKAPDGYLLCGERRVRSDGTVLFNRGWWKLPPHFADQGEYVWVHSLEGEDNFHEIEVAPPGYRSFYAAALDRATVICPRTDRPDAKPARPSRPARVSA